MDESLDSSVALPAQKLYSQLTVLASTTKAHSDRGSKLLPDKQTSGATEWKCLHSVCPTWAAKWSRHHTTQQPWLLTPWGQHYATR